MLYIESLPFMPCRHLNFFNSKTKFQMSHIVLPPIFEWVSTLIVVYRRNEEEAIEEGEEVKKEKKVLEVDEVYSWQVIVNSSFMALSLKEIFI